MDSCPAWLTEKDDTSKNWMDLDNKMTETIALVHALADKYFLNPDDDAMIEKAEKVEKLCFGIMNTMVGRFYTFNRLDIFSIK